METYRIGTAWVTGFVFGSLVLIAILDFACELAHVPSISYRVERWSRSNRWFAGGLILALGVFLAHFLLNPLPPPSLGS